MDIINLDGVTVVRTWLDELNYAEVREDQPGTLTIRWKDGHVVTSMEESRYGIEYRALYDRLLYALERAK